MSFPHNFQHNVEISVERVFAIFRHFRHIWNSFQHFPQWHFQQSVERFVKEFKYMPAFQHSSNTRSYTHIIIVTISRTLLHRNSEVGDVLPQRHSFFGLSFLLVHLFCQTT